MRRVLALGAFAFAMLQDMTLAAAPPPIVVLIEPDRYEISGEGNTVSGVRHAPVPYTTVMELTTAVQSRHALPAAVRLMRGVPPEVVDYVLSVTEDGVLVVGQQIRRLDGTGQYVVADGDIKRAYQALEATVPWMWIVDIPLGREVALILEFRATSHGWPVRGVTVTPRVTQ